MKRKILHVVGAMNRGGIETWLMHVIRHINRDEFQIDFLVHTDREADYDQEIRSLGGRIHYGGNPKNPVHYAKRFMKLLREEGPFSVVHSHVFWYSGYILWLAYGAGVPIRIAHSHTAVRGEQLTSTRRLYQQLMRILNLRYATHCLGISRASAQGLFGSRTERKVSVLPYGFDFTRFRNLDAPVEVKLRLGIPPHRKVVGHIGRFAPVKNHSFIVEVFQHMVAGGSDVHLLLVGDGPLLPAIRSDIELRHLSERCTFAGSQTDVVPFLAAMDVFLLPSVYEGLGIVAVEAQAAGVPVIASSTIPEEVDVIPGLVERIPLEDKAAAWAAAVLRRIRYGNARSGDEAVMLENSRFALQRCIGALSRIYDGAETTSIL